MADSACVVMLCMVTTMLVGVANPERLAGAAQVRSVPALAAAHSSIQLLPKADVRALVEAPVIASGNIQRTIVHPPQRPSSLAVEEPLNAVLGGVRSRLWLPAAVYSPDRVIDEQRAALVGQFRAVGFPAIRTHKQKKRSPWDPPGPWAPLIAWRTLTLATNDGIEVAEPIARVRCMGLTPQAVARRADRYREMIYTYAQQYEVSPHLVKAVITEESCFNNKALSPVGAQGLMQLMPDTASWLKVKDPHNPAQNVRAGVKYLASLQKQFDTLELALAAYNAGPGNVRRYKGVPPFAETRNYVAKVQSHYRRYQAAYRLLHPVDNAIAQASNAVLTP